MSEQTMDGLHGGRDGATTAVRRAPVAPASFAGFLAISPPQASATEQVLTCRIPISVDGYEVKQTIVGGPRPPTGGHITHMEVDVVDADGSQVPIDRLMLHHIVFLNTGRQDQSCDFNEGILGFDSRSVVPAVERFFAAGEERAKMAMPSTTSSRSSTNPGRST